MPQLRKNPITREWVVIATERSKRPSDLCKPDHAPAKLPFVENCPFCPGHEAMTPPEVLAFRDGEAANSEGWWVRVVPNKFPALQMEGELDRDGAGMYDWMNGIGAHEVIVETPEHDKCIASVDETQAQEVWWACRQRMQELGQDPRFKYILVFRNHGKIAGASLEHPHSQLIALPMVPMGVKTELLGAEKFYDYHERCIFCDMIRQELNYGQRVVVETDNFLAFEPFAPKYPFETWVIPKKHSRSFVEDGEALIPEFSHITQDVLKRIGRCLNYPPYNYTLHTVPCDGDKNHRFHWHLEIMPRLTIAAGFEMGTGVYINVTAPEDAAKHLRDAGDESYNACVPEMEKSAVRAG